MADDIEVFGFGFEEKPRDGFLPNNPTLTQVATKHRTWLHTLQTDRPQYKDSGAAIDFSSHTKQELGNLEELFGLYAPEYRPPHNPVKQGLRNFGNIFPEYMDSPCTPPQSSWCAQHNDLGSTGMNIRSSCQGSNTFQPKPRDQPRSMCMENLVCENCGEEFTGQYRKGNLKRHIRLQHIFLQGLCFTGGSASALGVTGLLPYSTEISNKYSGSGYLSNIYPTVVPVLGFTLSIFGLHHLNRRHQYQDHSLVCGIFGGICVGFGSGWDLKETILLIIPWTLLLCLCMSSLMHGSWYRQRTSVSTEWLRDVKGTDRPGLCVC